VRRSWRGGRDGGGKARLRVTYFIAHRDAAGVEEERVELPEGATVAALLEELVRRHPGLAALADDTVVSVNKGMGLAGTVLRDGDEVALIPPVEGG